MVNKQFAHLLSSFRLGVIAVVSTVFTVLSSSSVFAADENISNDRFNFRLGLYSILNTESTLSFTGPAVLGASLNTKRDLGMENKLQTPFLDGYFRFNARHALLYSWYRTNRDGEVKANREFEWGDETFPLNADLSTNYDTDVYQLSYLWSFHHDKKVELGLVAGFHITRIAVAISGKVNDEVIADEDVSVTAPLPVLGFKLAYDIIPKKLIWWTKSNFFYLNFDKYVGSLNDLSTNIEWRVFRNVGFGIGLRGTRLDLEADEGNRVARFRDTTNGATLYVTTYF